MNIRAEVPQGHKRPRAGVDHLVAGRRGVGRDEQLVGGHLAEADEGRRGDVVDTHLSLPLNRDPAARAGDTVSILDVATGTLAGTVWTKSTPADLFGAQPGALAFAADGARLYVCNAGNSAP